MPQRIKPLSLSLSLSLSPSVRPSRQFTPDIFAIPNFRTSTFQNSFYLAVIYSSHSLPETVCSSPTIGILKGRLFRHLFDLENELLTPLHAPCTSSGPFWVASSSWFIVFQLISQLRHSFFYWFRNFLFASDTVDLQFKVGSEPPGDAEKHRKIHWCLAGFKPRTPIAGNPSP